MKLLCIDPGKSGGLAWTDGNGTVECRAMPDTDGAVLDALRSIRAGGTETAYIERVVGFIPSAGQGAMFTFGEGTGFLRGCLMALGFRVILVRPAQWQKSLSLGAKKDHGKDWKRHLKAEAERRFPNCDVTLKTADALLLLDFARSLRYE